MLHRLAPLPPSAPSPYILLTSTRPTPTELGRTLATRLYDLSSTHREGGEGNLWRHASTHDNARRHTPARPVTVAKDGEHRRGLCVSPPCADERRGEASRPCVLEIAEPVGAFQSPRSSSDGLGVAQPSHLASRRRHQSRRPSRPGGLVQPTASVYPRPSTAGTHWNGALPVSPVHASLLLPTSRTYMHPEAALLVAVLVSGAWLGCWGAPEKRRVCFARRLVTEREHRSRPGNDITNTASCLHVTKPEWQVR